MDKDKIKQKLSEINYPGFSRDIVSFGMIDDIILDKKSVKVILKISTSQNDKKDKVKESDAIALAEEYNMPFIKISSLRIQKVSCVVPALCEEIVQKSLKKGFLTGIRLLDNEKDTNSIRETTECKKEPKRCCIIS